MAKIQIKSEKLTPFGGFFSIMEQFDSMTIPVNNVGKKDGTETIQVYVKDPTD